MARRKKSMSNGALFLIALVVFGISGMASYLYMNGVGRRGAVPVVQTHRPTAPTVSVTEDARKVTVYVTEATSDALYLKPVTRTTESKGDILDAAMEAFLSTSTEQGDSGSLIPKGTRMLSPVKVSDGVATVNLSREFGSFTGGSKQEALTLNAIAQTLVKNSGGTVKSVLILIEGEPVESLGGDSDLTKPITPSSAMLKPGN